MDAINAAEEAAGPTMRRAVTVLFWRTMARVAISPCVLIFPARRSDRGGAASSNPSGEARVKVPPSLRSIADPSRGCAPNVSVKGFVYPSFKIVPAMTSPPFAIQKAPPSPPINDRSESGTLTPAHHTTRDSTHQLL